MRRKFPWYERHKPHNKVKKVNQDACLIAYGEAYGNSIGLPSIEMFVKTSQQSTVVSVFSAPDTTTVISSQADQIRRSSLVKLIKVSSLLSLTFSLSLSLSLLFSSCHHRPLPSHYSFYYIPLKSGRLCFNSFSFFTSLIRYLKFYLSSFYCFLPIHYTVLPFS